MESPDGIVGSATTLDPLPPALRRGLIAVSFFGLLSLICSVLLFFRLAYKLLTWQRRTQARANQFVVLIFNLILADIQQSLAFTLNIQWLRDNAILSDSHVCQAQAWFVGSGDLASGVFTLAIALHSFLDITYDFRLGHAKFVATLVALWTFVYACSIIGIGLHPSDIFSRAGAWCWVNVKYDRDRLYLHYIWVIIAEFGTVIIYLLTFLILRHRIDTAFYSAPATAMRAKSAARFIVAYPIAYVVCTLPLVKARLTTIAGRDVGFVEFCVGGAMITSNGWIDVLLYSFTRRALVFGPDMLHDNVTTLDTFKLTLRPDQAFGTTTTITAHDLEERGDRHLRRTASRRAGSDGRHLPSSALHSRHGSTDELFQLHGVKAETVVHVRTEVAGLDRVASEGGESHKSSEA